MYLSKILITVILPIMIRGGFLAKYKSEVIFDEIQRVPYLVSYLQTHVDQYKEKGKIIITGSHNFLLMAFVRILAGSARAQSIDNWRGVWHHP